MFVSNLRDFFAPKLIPFRANDNIRPSEVTTDNFIGFFRFGRYGFKLYIQVITTVFPFGEGSGLRGLSFQQSPLIVPDSQSETFPPAQHRQAHRPIFLSKTKGSDILGRGSGFKSFYRFTVFLGRLAGNRNASDRVDGQLRGKTEFRPDILIDKVGLKHETQRPPSLRYR